MKTFLEGQNFFKQNRKKIWSLKKTNGPAQEFLFQFSYFFELFRFGGIFRIFSPFFSPEESGLWNQN